MRDKKTGVRITATCSVFGHDIKFQDNDNLELTMGRDRGLHRVVKGYYKGRMFYCGRTKCDWSEFKGEEKPHRMIVYDHLQNTIEEYHGNQPES